jgi:putative methionine-R-sulfoxide reductase with GAF domain
MLMLLLQANKALDETKQKAHRLSERVKAMMQKEQKADDSLQHQEEFNVNEALTRIMHAIGSDFDNVSAYIEKVLQNIAKEMDIVQGLVFVLNDADQMFHISGEYAYYSEEKPRSFPIGETLSGQVAKNRQLLNIKELPEGYITILSGLGKSSPRHLIIAPFIRNGKCIGVMELSSFKPFGVNEELLIRRICEEMADLLNELRN